MTDLGAITAWVNSDESFVILFRSGDRLLNEKDVCYIRDLGSPTEENIEFFFRGYASASKRLVVSGVTNPCEWVRYFNRVNEEFMEIDDRSFIFDKSL